MSGAAPRVSVLLPVRDAQATLGAALRSVARQREARLECVIVDDASEDGSAEIAREAARSDARFRVVAGPGRGLVAALETGLAQCRTPFVARMDADDVMHRERLAAQLAALDADPALAGIGCHVRLHPRGALSEGMRAYESWLNAIDSPAAVRREAFIECPVAHPTWLIRRKTLAAHPYREAGWAEDYDLVLRLLAAGCELGVLPRRLHLWRDGEGRLSRTHPVYAAARFTACKAAFLASGLLAQHEHYVLWGYGATGRELRRALLAHGRAPSHVVELHPGRLGQRIHGAPVIPPQELPRIPRRPVVVSVAGAGPRSEIRACLARLGFRECSDFVCAA